MAVGGGYSAVSLVDRLRFAGLVLWAISLPVLLPLVVMWLFGNP
ncbi:hypothetical protein AB0I53_43855 [Saccharopolyspora sp. NPDC050389]